VVDLAAGIAWVLREDLRQASRERAVARFSNAGWRSGIRRCTSRPCPRNAVGDPDGDIDVSIASNSVL
jgi:hypothetical protein